MAVDGDRIVGHVAYRIGPDGCELMAIAAEPRRVGIGSRLLERVVEAPRGRLRGGLADDDERQPRRAAVLPAAGVPARPIRPGAVDEARRTMKPELPEIGAYGIPMRDELDLELPLSP